MAIVMIDEIHVHILVPTRLSPSEVTAIQRCLNGNNFKAAFRRTTKTLFRRYPSLGRTTIRVSR